MDNIVKFFSKAFEKESTWVPTWVWLIVDGCLMLGIFMGFIAEGITEGLIRAIIVFFITFCIPMLIIATRKSK